MRTILISFFSLLLLIISACGTTSTTSNTTNVSENNSYTKLPANKSVISFVGKKISLVGKKSEMVHQHMMKGSLDGKEKHIYIDYNDGNQIVGYYSGFTIPDDKKTHTFYGTVDKMSGAGKGGGTHTEYYIDLDKVE